MWPWGHLAVGYLAYAAFVHLRERGTPGDRAAIALAVGTQFPDLVDKPLAWSLAVLPNGRSLAHSLVTAILVISVLQALFARRGEVPLATAFSVGYLSHLFGDALGPALIGDFPALGFLAWPLVPPVEYSTEQSFVAHLRQLSLDAFAAFELALVGAAVLVWLADGAPGFDVLAAIPRWFGRKLST